MSLPPLNFAFRQFPQPQVAKVFGNQFADLQQESQIAALRGGSGTGALGDFDQADGLLLAEDRHKQEEIVGGIADGSVIGKTGLRRSGERLMPIRHAIQQGQMSRRAE